jgi:LysR family transcriptional regulator, nitrogen assimilation regulatory protein
MELRQLRYFAKIAEVGSFTRAAAILDIAQPALSRQIRELELELGVSLLVRNGRGAVLTDAGITFLRRAKMILDDADRAFQEVRALKGQPMGLVSVGMQPPVSRILTVPMVSQMRTCYPEIQLQLTEAYSGHLHEWLLCGRLDVGTFYVYPRGGADPIDRLANEELYLLGTPAAVDRHLGEVACIAFRDVPALPLILPARPHAIRRLIDEVAARHHLDINLGLEVNAYLAIRDLVANGHCFTVMPISAVLPEIRAGVIKPVKIVEPQLLQMVGLMTSTHHSPSLAAKTVVRVMQELALDMIASGAWPQSYQPERLARVPAPYARLVR